MKHCKNDGRVAFKDEIHGIWKSTEKSSTDIVEYALASLRPRQNPLVREVELIQESLTETRELSLVPVECRFDVRIGIRSAYEPCHRYRLRSRKRSITSRAGLAASGFCRCSARRD